MSYSHNTTTNGDVLAKYSGTGGVAHSKWCVAGIRTAIIVPLVLFLAYKHMCTAGTNRAYRIVSYKLVLTKMTSCDIQLEQKLE